MWDSGGSIRSSESTKLIHSKVWMSEGVDNFIILLSTLTYVGGRTGIHCEVEEPYESRGSRTVLCLRTIVLWHTGVRGLGVKLPLTYSSLLV